jgi:Transient receptor potential (TRP) ion channel/ML-like domain
MHTSWSSLRGLGSALVLLSTLHNTLAADVLQTTGFSMCNESNTIEVQRLNISYSRATQQITFDVAGTSTKIQNVTATLTVTAYGQQVYKNSFDPCDPSTHIAQLCPLPAGTYSASGTQTIPSQYASLVPAIAFDIPDVDGQATLSLNSESTGNQVACIQSTIGNGKTINIPAVPLISAGIAGSALVVSSLSVLAFNGGAPGASPYSPGFLDVMGWFQSMALNGMLSINYPTVYRSFTKNFAFSAGLLTWPGMQKSIEGFRLKTGGNLTEQTVEFLQYNATLQYANGGSTITRRSLMPQDNTNDTSKAVVSVQGIQAFVEPLMIPSQNAFMTVLLITSIVFGGIVLGILLFKGIAELWAKWGTLPKKLAHFRQRYWIIMAKTLTTLILLLYGTWTLYCIYELTQGDSVGAKVLAGVTLGIFTTILGWYTWKIWRLHRSHYSLTVGGSALYEDKTIWSNYGLFYESYKQQYWWMFVPLILFMFARGLIIAVGDGNGVLQVGGQLVLEVVVLIVLIIFRPYSHTSSNWICILIQVFRALSVLFLLVFVDQLAIPDAAKAITGVALVAIQAGITGILVLLIAVNAILACIKRNRFQGKDEEKNDDLTPLDAHNSMLLDAKIRMQQEKRQSTSGSSTYSTSNPAVFGKATPQVKVLDYTSANPFITNPRKPSSTRGPLLPRVSLPFQYRLSRF